MGWRGVLFGRRRVFRRGFGGSSSSSRGSSSSSSSGSSSFVGGDGRRFAVVEVEDGAGVEFGDPSRGWGRVLFLVVGWVVLVFVGAGVAPGFAASGSTENESVLDDDPLSPKHAANRYLTFGTEEDPDKAKALICDDTFPEVTPEDLDEIRQSYGDITDVDVSTGDPVPEGDSFIFTTTVYFYVDTKPDEKQFEVTVQESGETYCVSNAVELQVDNPGPDDPTPGSPDLDPEVLANDFMAQVVGNRELTPAKNLLCESYSDITVEDLLAAVDAWEAKNGWRSGSIRGATPIEAESTITMFSVEVKLEGDITQTFTFEVGVQGDCIASLAGGESLIALAGD